MPEQWLLRVSDDEGGNRRPALRYKMRFEGLGEKKIQANYKSKDQKNEIHSLYFASMGNSDSGVWDANGVSKTKSVFYEDGVELTILSLAAAPLECTLPLYQGELKKPTLLEILNALIPAFFALHCFGTRSGKGFGSFEVISNRNLSDAELDYYKERDCQKLYRISSKERIPESVKLTPMKTWQQAPRSSQPRHCSC